MSTPIKSLEQLQKEANDALAALEAGKKRETEKELKGVKDDLEAAHKAFIALNHDSQSAFLADEKVKEWFSSFGFKRKASKTGGGGSGNTLKKNKDAILEFLKGGKKPQKDIQLHFKTTRQSVTGWGKRLKEAGLIRVGENAANGRENEWELVKGS